MRAALVVVALSALAAYVNAECANACSGHGVCVTSDQCDCFPNYRAADCSERICPYGFAWVDSPRGDLNHDGVVEVSTAANRVAVASYQSDVSYEYEQFPNDVTGGKVAATNEGHFYSECSNKGLCDRATGECVCYDGYTGSSCQRSACPNDCSGHGVCRTVAEIAAGGLTNRKVDNVGGDTFWEGTSGSSIYQLWDSDMAQACVCDPYYTGADCSRRQCPRGDDPLTHRAADCGGNPCTVEVQTLTVTPSAADAADWVYLQFTDWTGKTWNTDKFVLGNSLKQCGNTLATSATVTANTLCSNLIQGKLRGLPNGVLSGVTAACTFNAAGSASALTITVTFVGKPGNVESLTIFRSNEFDARNDPTATCSGYLTIPAAAETVRGNEEESKCSNRGVCDHDTGLCKCFKGYSLDDCSQQNALAQ